MKTAKAINQSIEFGKKSGRLDTNLISDTYHTFGELYEHRIVLFIALCNLMTEVENPNKPEVWKSKLQSDGTMFSGGWFIAGIYKQKGLQITYHLPIKYWEQLTVQELAKAPEWDGHTPEDVVKRLLELC